MPEVVTHREGHCLHIVFNRPERLNAVNEPLYQQTLAALREAETDGQTRCVVLSGQGRAFCAGADLKAHGSGQRSERERTEYVMLGQEVCAQIQHMRIPVVAQVHGYAIGGGAEIATSADFLVIAEDAMIGFPESAIGTYVGGGVTTRLPRLVGLRKTAELLLFGRRIGGVEAARCGLANVAVPQEDLAAATANITSILCANAPVSMAVIKAAINASTPPDDVFRTEARALLDIMRTDDWREGVRAFAEKRTPRFSGQ